MLRGQSIDRGRGYATIHEAVAKSQDRTSPSRPEIPVRGAFSADPRLRLDLSRGAPAQRRRKGRRESRSKVGHASCKYFRHDSCSRCGRHVASPVPHSPDALSRTERDVASQSCECATRTFSLAPSVSRAEGRRARLPTNFHSPQLDLQHHLGKRLLPVVEHPPHLAPHDRARRPPPPGDAPMDRVDRARSPVDLVEGVPVDQGMRPRVAYRSSNIGKRQSIPCAMSGCLSWATL